MSIKPYQTEEMIAMAKRNATKPQGRGLLIGLDVTHPRIKIRRPEPQPPRWHYVALVLALAVASVVAALLLGVLP